MMPISAVRKFTKIRYLLELFGPQRPAPEAISFLSISGGCGSKVYR
jgi:hypothetical protein